MSRQDARAQLSKGASTMGALTSSASDEWYTPPEFAEAARRVLRIIDLDPASCAIANAVIRARRFYSREDDGLSHPWRGRLFMNPPFGKQVGRFVGKLLVECQAGNVEAAVVVCAARLETRWFQPLFEHSLCFPSSRIRFWSPGRKPGPPFTPAVVYIGPERSAFIREFSRLGPIVERVDG